MAPFFRYPPDRVSKTEAGAIRNHPDTSLPQPPRFGSKREAEGIRKRPQLPNLHMRLSGRKPLNQHPNNPRNRREKAFQTKFEMPSPHAFSSTPSKGASSFRRNQQGSPAATRRSGCGGEEEGQRSGMRDALPRRASRIWRSLTRRRMGVLKLPGFPGTPVSTGQTPLF